LATWAAITDTDIAAFSTLASAIASSSRVGPKCAASYVFSAAASFARAVATAAVRLIEILTRRKVRSAAEPGFAARTLVRHRANSTCSFRFHAQVRQPAPCGCPRRCGRVRRAPHPIARLPRQCRTPLRADEFDQFVACTHTLSARHGKARQAALISGATLISVLCTTPWGSLRHDPGTHNQKQQDSTAPKSAATAAIVCLCWPGRIRGILDCLAAIRRSPPPAQDRNRLPRAAISKTNQHRPR